MSYICPAYCTQDSTTHHLLRQPEARRLLQILYKGHKHHSNPARPKAMPANCQPPGFACGLSLPSWCQLGGHPYTAIVPCDKPCFILLCSFLLHYSRALSLFVLYPPGAALLPEAAPSQLHQPHAKTAFGQLRQHHHAMPRGSSTSPAPAVCLPAWRPGPRPDAAHSQGRPMGSSCPPAQPPRHTPRGAPRPSGQTSRDS